MVTFFIILLCAVLFVGCKLCTSYEYMRGRNEGCEDLIDEIKKNIKKD